GIVGNAELATVLALLHMTAEHCRATRLDGGHDPPLGACQALPLRGREILAVAAEDVRHLEHRTHAPVNAGGTTMSERRSKGLGVPEMRREAVPERVNRH